MEDSTVTLVIGLAGIIGTIVSGFIGHLTATRSRKNQFQEKLFQEQLSLLKEIHLALGHVKSAVPILARPDYEGYPRAEANVRASVASLIELAHISSAILPSELWIDLNQLIDLVCGYMDKEPTKRTNEDISAIAGKTGTFAIASRRLLGIDEMAIETTQMITGTKESDFVSAKGRNELADIAQRRLGDPN